MDTQHTELDDSIAAGFGAARRPTTLWELGEAAENPAFRDLLGRTPDDVPLATVQRLCWDLEWFQRPGLRYYLPCFLRGALIDDEVAEAMIAYLARGSGDRNALWPSEKRAVRKVLLALRDRGRQDAGQALAAYWDALDITGSDEVREQLARRVPAAFPGEQPAVDCHELDRRGAYELAELGIDELRRRLPALLGALLERSTTGLLALLSPPETPDRELLARLASALSADQTRLIRDVMAYAHARDPARWGADGVRFWDQAPDQAP
jgi:hypothetical protein